LYILLRKSGANQGQSPLWGKTASIAGGEGGGELRNKKNISIESRTFTNRKAGACGRGCIPHSLKHKERKKTMDERWAEVKKKAAASATSDDQHSIDKKGLR